SSPDRRESKSKLQTKQKKQSSSESSESSPDRSTHRHGDARRSRRTERMSKSPKRSEHRGDREKHSSNHAQKDARRDSDRPSKRRSHEKQSPRQGKYKDVSKDGKTQKEIDPNNILTRTGGAYIPPARLRMMQAQITDKTSAVYQRMAWEALKKSINGLINKVNISNIDFVVRELFQENIVRGRGVLARSVIQAQAASPTFTHVYAALVAILNTKFPQNGELILKRLVIQFRRGFRRNDKNLCLSSTRFIAHLVNQQVAHEVLALEILTLLLDSPTDDSVEIAIGFLKEVGQKLSELSPRGINAIFDRLRNILHEGQIDKRVQYMMEVMFAIRKDGFKEYQAVIEKLDLVEDNEQFTHLLSLEQAGDPEDILNVFKADENYQENEEKYKTLKKGILEESSTDEEGSGSDSGSGSSDSSASDDEEKESKQTIIDSTETNMVVLRRTIYLTIQSSLDYEECAHKLLKMELKPGQEVELCNMILDCCCQLRTYEKFFGLLAQRFCQMDKKYVEPFQIMFKEQYETIHRLETGKLRNCSKFFAHLLYTDAISWGVMCCISLNEEDTTSASRIFIKLLFQELSEYMGLPKLNDRFKDQSLQPYFEGIMPRDNPKNTRFAINFFTTIGLGGLTEELRNHLKDVTKQLMEKKEAEQAAAEAANNSSDDSSDDSSDSSSSSSSSNSESSSSESESEKRKKKRKKKSEPVVEEKSKRKHKEHHHRRHQPVMDSFTDPWARQTPKNSDTQRSRRADFDEQESSKSTSKRKSDVVRDDSGNEKENRRGIKDKRKSENSREEREGSDKRYDKNSDDRYGNRGDYRHGDNPNKRHGDRDYSESDLRDKRRSDSRDNRRSDGRDDRHGNGGSHYSDNRYDDGDREKRQKNRYDSDSEIRKEKNKRYSDEHYENERENRYNKKESYASDRNGRYESERYASKRRNGEYDSDRYDNEDYKRAKRDVDTYEDSQRSRSKRSGDRDQYYHNKENYERSPRKRYHSPAEDEITLSKKRSKSSRKDHDFSPSPQRERNRDYASPQQVRRR
ncbi:hypothetical protein LOTGIDRAFT_138828, partial [Lottia gigantea]